jgi:hypothetical protein
VLLVLQVLVLLVRVLQVRADGRLCTDDGLGIVTSRGSNATSTL